MSALVPPEQAGDHAPYALSAPGHLEAALASAGLRVTDHGEVVCWWRYAGLEDAVRALLCSADRDRRPAEHVPVGGGRPVTETWDGRT